MTHTPHLVAVTLAAVAALAPRPSAAGEATDAALAHCDAAATAPRAAALDFATRGVALAEAAIEADPTDASAHFALFCNLGRQMRHEGIGLRAFAKVRRLRGSVDRALELRPDYSEALVGKAMLLRNLPRFMGGDDDAARRLLEQALDVDPGHALARAVLAGADPPLADL